MAKASVSAVIGASADDVWKVVGEFGGIANWHPAIAKSELSPGKPGDAVGSIRTCTLGDGAQLREEQTARSDAERSYTYSILESPMPVENYISTVKVTPDGDKAPSRLVVHLRRAHRGRNRDGRHDERRLPGRRRRLEGTLRRLATRA